MTRKSFAKFVGAAATIAFGLTALTPAVAGDYDQDGGYHPAHRSGPRIGYGYGGYARRTVGPGCNCGGYGYGTVGGAGVPYYYGTPYPYGYYQYPTGYAPTESNPYYGYGTGEFGLGLGY